jgi:hypothetical protein
MLQGNDDLERIPDETRLFRRINPNWVVFDRDRKELRPTSQNFQDSPDGSPMSVFAENVALAHGESPGDFLTGRWSVWYLAAVNAGSMRACGQRVYLDPHNQDEDDMHPSHAAVAGPKDQKHRSKLSRNYEWVVAPANRYEPA